VQQAREAKKSGFLGDYSQLKKGDGDRAMFYYVNPDNFKYWKPGTVKNGLMRIRSWINK